MKWLLCHCNCRYRARFGALVAAGFDVGGDFIDDRRGYVALHCKYIGAELYAEFAADT